MSGDTPTVAVLGASGLIGEAIASHLQRSGISVVPIARRFTASQKALFGHVAVETPIVTGYVEALAQLLSRTEADIVVNCIGVLADGPRGKPDAINRDFVARLLEALGGQVRQTLLVHVSIPGRDDEDRTPFSLSKREAERRIVAATVPYVILRPGFVIAPAAYGGSALFRALAALPVKLGAREANAAFAVTDIADIAKTAAVVARRWQNGERRWNVIWDILERQPSTVGNVLEAFRHRLNGPARRVPLPSWLLDIGAAVGDLTARLGWTPPIRKAALAEMRRGVTGDPAPWIAATGIEPASLTAGVNRLPATVQEKWFARLYLLKPLVLGVLVVFWAASGCIALFASFHAATAILTAHQFSPPLAAAVTTISSLADIAVGVAIAHRKSCRAGLIAGIALSVSYMTGAAIVAPSLWLEPLGALVKTAPAIVLMLLALAILDDR